jgi:hypothetical protein
MTPAEFLHALEQVLRQRRLPFSRAAAITFVESCWELIDDDPDVWSWSDRFTESQGVSYAAEHCGRIAVAQVSTDTKPDIVALLMPPTDKIPRCPVCKEPMATPEWRCPCGKYKTCSRPSCMLSIPVEHRTGTCAKR